MKKKLMLVVAAMMTAIMILACASAGASKEAEAAAPTEAPKEEIPVLNMDDLTCEVITTEAGEYVPVATTYTDIPAEFRTKCATPGTFIWEDYTTDLYYGGETIRKHLQVYLPYCYDENDTDTKYNVLYYAHGNGSSCDKFAATDNRYPIDHIFATAKFDPVIIVFVTYYTGKLDESGEKEGTDGRSAGIAADFYLEVLEDIIPLVETKYHTYLNGMEPTLENIEATREHRGFSGYSRGGRCTYYMFRYALPYFKWFAPMSATCDGYAISSLPSAYQDSEYEAIRASYPLKENGLGYAPYDEVLAYLKNALDEFPGYSYYIYATSGMEDDRPLVYDQMTYFLNEGFFSYGSDPVVNNLYYSMSHYDHNDFHAPASWFNTLRILFHD